jgi:hypothetical protein
MSSRSNRAETEHVDDANEPCGTGSASDREGNAAWHWRYPARAHGAAAAADKPLKTTKPLRVLHAPWNVGNQPWTLSRQELLLGMQSEVVVNSSTWLKYNTDVCLGDTNDTSLRARWRRLRFAMMAGFRYDVLHFYFGQSFLGWGNNDKPHPLWFKDLKLARRLGRKIFMTLQGCDVRMSDFSDARNEVTPCKEGHCQWKRNCLASLDRRRRRLIEEILPLVDRVFVLNPELAYEVPGACFLPYTIVDVEAIGTVPPRTEGRITILHAPSDPAIKGTALITAAIEKLKHHYPIDFIQVTGLPHEEAMKIYPRADLVIDQVLAGWYGGFAVEIMAMGKPVACYLREEDFRFVPPEMLADLPVLNVHPGRLEEDLARILEQRQQWPEWGRQSRQYAVRWHDPARIARAMVAAYHDPHSLFSLT